MTNLFATYGGLKLELFGAPKSWSTDRKAALVEHGVISGKPMLEGRGTELIRISAEVTLDVAFGEIQPTLDRWVEIHDKNEAHDLARGDGKPLGRFSIATLKDDLQIADQLGRPLKVKLSLELVEAPEPVEPMRVPRPAGIGKSSASAKKPDVKPPASETITNPDGYSTDLIIRK